jgi:acetylornithine deacetylase
VDARRALEAAVAAAADGHVELRWPGGQFASGETPAEHPFARVVRASVSAEIGREAPVAGVPWGADMRLWCARGIPCVMAGPSGIELSHAVDERVRIDDLVTVARAVVRVVHGFATA